MPWPLIKLLPEKTNFRFVALAKFASTLSALAVIASLVGVFYPGLNRGIDFKGGTVLELSTAPKAVDLALVRDTLNRLHLGDVEVQTVGDPTDARVGFQTPDRADAGATVTEVKTALSQALGQVKYSRTDLVGPKFSGELFVNGLIALGLAIGLMLLYIWFRFELQFGLGAVAALFHDVFLTFGMIAILRIEFDLKSVAAILTIIGYSMNDTVVVFDRFRENLRKYKRMPLGEVIDMSINEMLTRTIITSMTAVLALVALAFFGGPTLYSLSVIMLFGIAIGTYSSIYIAAPVILLWGVKRGGEDEVAEPLKPVNVR